MPFANKIKLIIWDLDETLWRGVLSEGPVVLNDDCIKIVGSALDRGIISSICSKNEQSTVFNQLKEFNIFESFVFPSINWSSKGERTKNIICSMNLREENVLFIDDNVFNLQEVKSICTKIMILDVLNIKQLQIYLDSLPVSDPNHLKLSQYKILEKKFVDMQSFQDNHEFLKSCKIQLTIVNNKDNLVYVDRIEELLSKSNQLNFTKSRTSRSELVSLISNNNCSTQSIFVSDRYGDYGLIGFVCLVNNTLEIFSFSCRVMGMGIEQYVYKALHQPNINIVGEVSCNLFDDKYIDWISCKQSSLVKNKKKKNNVRVLLKGPCDLSSCEPYISAKNLDSEYSYTKNGIYYEQHNHSTMVLNFLNGYFRKESDIFNSIPFMDRDCNSTLITNDYDFVFLSTLIESQLGVYKNKASNLFFAFGEWCYPLTDKCNWDKYALGSIFTSNYNFSNFDFEKFSRENTFLGRLDPQTIANNLKNIHSLLPKKTRLVLILGSEIDIKTSVSAQINKGIYHKEVNKAITKIFRNASNVSFIRLDELASKLSDYTDTINHFKRIVYFRLAEKITKIIGAKTNRVKYVIDKFIVQPLKIIKNKIRTWIKKSD